MLGVEASFDDTSVAVVAGDGRVLANVVERQLSATHGTVPHITGQMHRVALPKVLDRALAICGVGLHELSGIACTVGPGLSPCLAAGLDFGRELARQAGLPFCPVHHMEAHALTARMVGDVQFPFLVLLASGGHCLLVLAESLGVYRRFGSTLDDSPGEALDKVARALGLSGGAAELERVAVLGDPARFAPVLSPPLQRQRTCDFSFAGLKTAAFRLIHGPRRKGSILAASLQDRERWINPTAEDIQFRADLAAAFQDVVVTHISVRTHRAMLYALQKGGLRPTHLVASGGVLCNRSLRASIESLCSYYHVPVVFPPLALCTDNAAMIAWTGLEYTRQGGRTILAPSDPALLALRYHPSWPLGTDDAAAVHTADISVLSKQHHRIITRRT